MKRYAKGANYERELLHDLNNKGFSVIRQASSGGFLTPVDIVAVKSGKILAIECKAWARMPKLEKAKAETFANWCENAGAHGFLAWRRGPPHSEWFFLPIKDVLAKDYSDEKWLSRQTWLKVFG